MRSKLAWLGRHADIMLALSIFVVILKLYGSNKLTLYVHPRYELFTVIASGIGCVFYVAGLLVYKKSKKVAHTHQRNVFVGLAAVAYSCAALFVPPSSLSSQIAQNRNTAINARIPDRNISLTQSANLQFDDWAWLVLQPGSNKTLEDKEASFIGFVMEKPGVDDRLYVSRFAVTCCAIDATPLQIEVQYPEWSNIAKQGEWVSVKGAFDGSEALPFLRAESMRVVPEPEVPYAF